MCAGVYMCIHICVHVCARVGMYVCGWMYTLHVCARVWVCGCACVYVCGCVCVFPLVVPLECALGDSGIFVVIACCSPKEKGSALAS